MVFIYIWYSYIYIYIYSPISQVSESDLYLTQGDQSLLETLETLCGSASTSSKFVDDRIKGNFVSGYVFNLSQKTLLPLEIKVLEKGLGFSPTPSMNEVDLRRDISHFSRKITCEYFFRNQRQENVSETSKFKSRFYLESSKRSACIRTVFKPDRAYFINTDRKGY